MVPVGFDYARAILDLRNRLTYEHIAEYCGYESKASIAAIADGAVPSHPSGEALYALYMEVFNKKPPMSLSQVEGTTFRISSLFVKPNRKAKN